MRVGEERLRLGYSVGRSAGWAPSLFSRALTVTAGALLTVAAVAVSIVLFVVTLAGIIVGGGYLWWKVRAARKHMHSWSPDADPIDPHVPEGNIIEGEVIHREVHDPGPRPGSRPFNM